MTTTGKGCAQVIELEAMLGERHAEFDSGLVKSDLDAFEVNYRQRVGTLHEQLDRLELAIAEAELGELSNRVEGAAGGSSESAPAARPAPAPRLTSDVVRALFRDVAKAISPRPRQRRRRPPLASRPDGRRPTALTRRATRNSSALFSKRGKGVPRRCRETMRRRSDCDSFAGSLRSKSSSKCRAESCGSEGLAVGKIESDGGRCRREGQGPVRDTYRSAETRHPGRDESSGRDKAIRSDSR